MIAKNILKRLALTFLLILGITFIHWGINDEGLHNEERQGNFLLLLLNIGICLLSGVLSLTALLNTKASVASNAILSLLAFAGLPSLLFIFLLSLFIMNRHAGETLSDFLRLGLSSALYCLILVVQYLLFRCWYGQHIKAFPHRP